MCCVNGLVDDETSDDCCMHGFINDDTSDGWDLHYYARSYPRYSRSLLRILFALQITKYCEPQNISQGANSGYMSG